MVAHAPTPFWPARGQEDFEVTLTLTLTPTLILTLTLTHPNATPSPSTNRNPNPNPDPSPSPSRNPNVFEAFLGWAELLAGCYVNGVKAVTAPQAAATMPPPVALATPLLGAG